MGQKVIETKGSDVEAAIRAGLAKLGLSREDVEIEILDQGSRGLLGIGARDAQVRLTALVVAEPEVQAVVEPVVAAPEPEPEPSPEPEPVVAIPQPVKTAVPPVNNQIL